MKNVKIYGSLPSHDEKLAELESIHFTMSLVDLISKNYNINAIYLDEGFINLYVNKEGENNFTFIESKSAETSQDLKFDIKNISITNTEIIYENIKLKQNHRAYAHNLDGTLSVKGAKTNIEINTKSDIQLVQSDGNKIIEDKQIAFTCNLLIDTNNKTINIPTTNITIDKSVFKGESEINYGNNTYSAKIDASNTDFNTILSLLPNNVSKPLKKYKSNGLANFSLLLDKNNVKLENPKIEISFGCKNVSLLEPNTKKSIKNLSFNGSFTNGNNHSNKSSSLVLRKLKGEFDNNPFEGEMIYKDFDNPFINTYLKGEFPISFFLQFSEQNKFKNVSGTAKVDIKIKAFQKDLVENNQEKINSSGEIILNEVSLSNESEFYNFKNVKGSFIFNKKDIAFSDFEGKINNSQFDLNGYLQGFFDYFFNKKGKLNIMAHLDSRKLDFDNLIESGNNNDTIQELDNSYLKNISFNIDANVSKLKWGKFNFKNVNGNLSQQNLIFNSDKIIAEIGGGGLSIYGNLNSRDKNNIKLSTTTTINKIAIDSILYYFNNFNEDFITHNNLKGSLYLLGTTNLVLDKYLNVKPESIISDLDVKVINGKLIGFEPMQNLSKFIDEDDLNDISFDELSDKIHIENEKIEISELKINSSISNITLKGSHTFDQHIYYKLKVPLKNLKQSKRTEAETAFENGKDGPTVHLIISGTTDDFKIKYDKKATKEVIEDKVKEEVNTIKEIINGNYEEEEKEQVGLDEEEFFDFDDDTTNF